MSMKPLAAVALLGLASIAAAAGAAPGPSTAGDIPRTASGRPDLSGNYSLGNILRGARILERETLAKRATARTGQK